MFVCALVCILQILTPGGVFLHFVHRQEILMLLVCNSCYYSILVHWQTDICGSSFSLSYCLLAVSKLICAKTTRFIRLCIYVSWYWCNFIIILPWYHFLRLSLCWQWLCSKFTTVSFLIFHLVDNSTHFIILCIYSTV